MNYGMRCWPLVTGHYLLRRTSTWNPASWINRWNATTVPICIFEPCGAQIHGQSYSMEPTSSALFPIGKRHQRLFYRSLSLQGRSSCGKMGNPRNRSSQKSYASSHTCTEVLSYQRSVESEARVSLDVYSLCVPDRYGILCQLFR